VIEDIQIHVERTRWFSPKENVGFNWDVYVWEVILVGGEKRFAYREQVDKINDKPIVAWKTGKGETIPNEDIVAYLETDFRKDVIFPHQHQGDDDG